MTFILAAERENDPVEAFRLYREYLRTNQASFPESAYALATSDWYGDFTTSGCPHGGWLKNLIITEPSDGTREEKRTVEITIELLGPYHDGVIQFRYPRVYGYQMGAHDLAMGHCDWRYDELRIDSSGNLIHEIEWWGLEATATSLIIASDVIYTWSPFKEGILHTNKATCR